MKITLDIPDDTVGMTLVFLCGNWGGLTMHNVGINQKHITDGAIITIDVNRGE